MSEKRTSVIVVNYNSGRYLQRCIQSLLYSDIKLSVVVVDNASSDNSLDLITDIDSNVHQLQIIRNSENVGFSRAVNLGATYTDCPYIFLLNPDCVVHPHTVQQLIVEIEKFPHAAMIGALVFNENGTEQRGCRREEPTLYRSAVKALRLGRYLGGIDLQHLPLPDTAISVEAISGSAMLFKRTHFDHVGGMDEQYFLHCEDLDICKRIRNAGYQVIFTPNVSLFHRSGAGSKHSPLHVELFKHRSMVRYYLQHECHSDGAVKKKLVRLLVWSRFLLVALKMLFNWGEYTKDDKIQVLPIKKNCDEILLLNDVHSDVGEATLVQLQQKKIYCLVISAKKSNGFSNDDKLCWMHPEYLEKVPADDIDSIGVWVGLTPLWKTRKTLGCTRIAPPKRLIVLSTNSIVDKSSSTNKKEKIIIQRLKESESWLFDYAGRYQVLTTVFRPTMIYGGRYNKNINLIARLIKIFRLFPLVGEAGGLRQPVHAEDIATACVNVMHAAKTYGQTYTLGGGEALIYREMVARLFRQSNIQPRFVVLPPPLIRSLLKILSCLPSLNFLNKEILYRMQQDLICENKQAEKDFAYKPRKFLPDYVS